MLRRQSPPGFCCVKMLLLNFVLLLVPSHFVCLSISKTVPKSDSNMRCVELPKEKLTQVLGAAFNSRYMSLVEPAQELEDEKEGGRKRASASSQLDLDFFVEGTYERDLSEEPAWNVDHTLLDVYLSNRRVRRSPPSSQPKEWHCEQKVAWIDLGADYFPRYLRTVECTSKRCWYGRYKCKPKSFAVKILKRRRDKCVVSGGSSKEQLKFLDGIPMDLRELWVWEERAVNFCCDCAM